MSAIAGVSESKAARIGATKALAAFITGAQVGDDAIMPAVRAVLDTIAVTIAGGAEAGVQALAASLAESGDHLAVPSFWSARAYRSDDAALLYGMASHVLDYDDVSMLTVCHPSAPVLSAVLAAAPWATTSGRDMLEAFVVGTEVLIRLGQAMGFRHYALGFHATGTLGTVGAAAACARLLHLDECSTGHAISIAASLSSGLRANFGSMVKSLHVGIAAANGLKAARLAAAGIEGAGEAIEGEGFLHAFSGGETSEWPADLPLGSPFAIVAPGFEQKRYPCCYMLHKIIEATLALRRETGLGLVDVGSVQVNLPQGATKPLIHPFPNTGLRALFSAPYAVVASLADGRIDLASFTDAAVMRPGIQARLRDVLVSEAGGVTRRGSDVGGAPVTVTLAPVRGGSVSRTVVVSPGSAADPLTTVQAAAKWVDCLQRGLMALGGAEAELLFDDGLALASMAAIGPWFERLRKAGRAGCDHRRSTA